MQRAVQIGLIVGVIAVYLAIVGCCHDPWTMAHSATWLSIGMPRWIAADLGGLAS